VILIDRSDGGRPARLKLPSIALSADAWKRGRAKQRRCARERASRLNAPRCVAGRDEIARVIRRVILVAALRARRYAALLLDFS
jgi:hypothetical protein